MERARRERARDTRGETGVCRATDRGNGDASIGNDCGDKRSVARRSNSPAKRHPSGGNGSEDGCFSERCERNEAASTEPAPASEATFRAFLGSGATSPVGAGRDWLAREPARHVPLAIERGGVSAGSGERTRIGGISLNSPPIHEIGFECRSRREISSLGQGIAAAAHVRAFDGSRSRHSRRANGNER